MSWWRYKLLPLLLWLALTSGARAASARGGEADTLSAEPSPTKGWHRFLPSQARVQYAGSVGALNAGLGWHYGGREKRLWETDFMFGFVPKRSAPRAHLTFTLRQSYVPFRLRIPSAAGRGGSRLAYEPLSTGLIANIIWGKHFWLSEPSRYPRHYYGFSTALRFHAFAGQRLRYELGQSGSREGSQSRRLVKAVSLCCELSASDLYLASCIPNRSLSLGRILSLSLGVKVDTR